MSEKSLKASFTKDDSLCLKGVAIIFLLLHHLFLSADRFSDYTVNFFPLTQGQAVHLCYYLKICVSIFAFITGYGLYLSAKKSCQSLKKTQSWTVSRLLKTMMPFWLVFILSFVASQLISGRPVKVYGSDHLATSAMYVVTDFLGVSSLFGTPTLIGTWWYMGAAIIFILFIPIAIKWTGKLGYLSLFLVVALVPRAFGIGFPGGNNPVPFLFAVIFGMMFAEYRVFEKISEFENKIKGGKILVFCALVLAMAVCYLFSIRLKRDVFWEFHFGITPIFTILFIQKYIVRIPVLRQVLRYIGVCSMDIFLTHTFLRALYLNDFVYSRGHWLIIFAALFIPSLALASLLVGFKKLIRFDRFVSFICKKACKPFE